MTMAVTPRSVTRCGATATLATLLVLLHASTTGHGHVHDDGLEVWSWWPLSAEEPQPAAAAPWRLPLDRPTAVDALDSDGFTAPCVGDPFSENGVPCALAYGGVPANYTELKPTSRQLQGVLAHIAATGRAPPAASSGDGGEKGKGGEGGEGTTAPPDAAPAAHSLRYVGHLSPPQACHPAISTAPTHNNPASPPPRHPAISPPPRHLATTSPPRHHPTAPTPPHHPPTTLHPPPPTTAGT